MIVLRTLRDPEWVDFSQRYAGVRILIRRLTTLEMREARSQAVQTLKAVESNLDALKPYGLHTPDATGVRLALTSEDQMARVGRLIGSVEVAIRAIEAWEGIADEGGALAPVTRETLSVLLMDDGMETHLIREVDRLARILVQEGNA